MKKLMSFIVVIAMFASSGIVALAEDSGKEVAVQKYIAEETTKIQESIEAAIICEDGTIDYLTPNVEIQRVGNLQGIQNRNAAPEDGVYMVTARAESKKQSVDRNKDIDASFTLIAYYERSGANLNLTKVHYSYAGNSAKATVQDRSLTVNRGVSKYPSNDSGLWNVSAKGTPLDPVTVFGQWQLKVKATGKGVNMGVKIVL